MTYETVLALCQIAAMTIFGLLMLAILVHVFRPANKKLFDDAAQAPLRDSDINGEDPHGRP